MGKPETVAVVVVRFVIGLKLLWPTLCQTL
jgi:hypothetical protein